MIGFFFALVIALSKVMAMIEEAHDGILIVKAVSMPKIWKAELEGKPIFEFEAWVSTEAVDRDGEIIRADGWRKESLRNNKFLLFHDDWSLPIGKPYWTRAKDEDGTKGLYTKGRFGPQLEGLAVGELYFNGDMDSFSVGFRWFKRLFDDQADGTKKPFFEYVDQELYEYSAVNIPANPEARIAMGKMLQDAGDIEDAKAMIKSFLKQKDDKPQEQGAYIIKSYQEKITDLEGRIKKLENEHNASEYEGDEIELDEFDDMDIEDVQIDDALEDGGDIQPEISVEIGDDASDIEVETETEAEILIEI